MLKSLMIFILACSFCAAQLNTGLPLFAADDLAGSSLAESVNGGKFVAEGWLADQNEDNLYYRLPEGILAGTVEYEAKGFKLSQPGQDQQNLWGVWDTYSLVNIWRNR